MKTWRYSAGGFGWYVAFIDEGGTVAVMSDYGNYAYRWHRQHLPPPHDIREFLTTADESYLLSKFAHRDEFDPTATRIAFKRHVLEFRRAHPGPKYQELCRMAYSGIDQISDWDELGFNDHIRDCDIDGIHETVVFDYPQQARAFMNEVWPRIIAAIKADLK